MQRSSWYSFAWAAALVACVVLLGPPVLKAGGCYSGASYSYGYQAAYPSYSYSYPATTYYASSYTPTYSYTPSYEVKEVVVPKAVRAYVSPDYFSSVSDYYKDKLLVDAIAGKNTDASKLKEELAELKAQIKGLSAAPPTQVSQPYAVPVQYQYPQALPPQVQQPIYQQPPSYQQPYAQQTVAQPPQSQPPQGQTPCDWRAQQAYQQGVQAAQQQYAYQGQQAQAQRAAYEQQRQVQYERSYNQQDQYQQPQPPRQPPSGYDHQGPNAPQYPQGPQSRQDRQAPQGQQSEQGREAPQPPYISPRNQAAPVGGQSVPEGQARNHAPAPLPGDYGPVPDGLSQTVSESCLRCHGDNNESAGHGFDLRDLRSVPLEDRMESYALVASGEMPSRAQPLSRDKVKLFKQWYREARKTQAMRQSSGHSVAAR